MMPIRSTQMKRPPLRTALLVWCVVVWLLIAYPASVWLIVLGAACHRALDRWKSGARLFGTDSRKGHVSTAQRIHHVPVTGHDGQAFLQNLGVIRGEHFANAAGNSRINRPMSSQERPGRNRAT